VGYTDLQHDDFEIIFHRGMSMRAEHQAAADDIRRSLALLRRHL